MEITAIIENIRNIEKQNELLKKELAEAHAKLAEQKKSSDDTETEEAFELGNFVFNLRFFDFNTRLEHFHKYKTQFTKFQLAQIYNSWPRNTNSRFEDCADFVIPLARSNLTLAKRIVNVSNVKSILENNINFPEVDKFSMCLNLESNGAELFSLIHSLFLKDYSDGMNMNWLITMLKTSSFYKQPYKRSIEFARQFYDAFKKSIFVQSSKIRALTAIPTLLYCDFVILTKEDIDLIKKETENTKFAFNLSADNPLGMSCFADQDAFFKFIYEFPETSVYFVNRECANFVKQMIVATTRSDNISQIYCGNLIRGDVVVKYIETIKSKGTPPKDYESLMKYIADI